MVLALELGATSEGFPGAGALAMVREPGRSTPWEDLNARLEDRGLDFRVDLEIDLAGYVRWLLG